MGTLLKAKLLKTNDPFIMLKCYLESVLKQDNLSWKDLIQSMIETREPKMSNELIDALEELRTKGDLPNVGRMLQGYVKPDADSTTTVPSEDPYLPSVRESNVRTLLNAIKRSDMEPTVVKPIIDGLERLLLDIQASQKTPPQRIAQTRGKVKYAKDNETSIKEAIESLTNIETALRTAQLDFDGDHVHSESLERLLPTIIKTKYDIAQLRRLAGRTYAEETASKPESKLKDLRQKLHGLLNKIISYNHHKRGREKGRLLDAILYAYEQDVGMALADITEHPKILARSNMIKDMIDERGLDVLISLAHEDNPELRAAILQRESDPRVREAMEQREADVDPEFQSMLEDLREGRTVER